MEGNEESRRGRGRCKGIGGRGSGWGWRGTRRQWDEESLRGMERVGGRVERGWRLVREGRRGIGSEERGEGGMEKEIVMERGRGE